MCLAAHVRGDEASNVHNGTCAETVLTHATGTVELEVPKEPRRHLRTGDRAETATASV